jgi:sugar lactone lactonase YvrE
MQPRLQVSDRVKRATLASIIPITVVGCSVFFGCFDLKAQKLAFDPKGNLFALSGYEIFRYKPDGTKSTFATLSKAPFSLAFDRAGKLFVAESGGSIIRFGAERTQSTFASGLTEAGNLACDAAGDLFVGDGVDFLILKFTPNKRKTTVAANVESERMVLDPSGSLLVPAHGEQKILKITPDGVTSVLATGIAYPFAPAVDSSGNLFVHGDPATIYKITPDGKKSAFVTGLNIDVWHAICDRTDNLFLADRNEGSILKFTPDGKQTAFGTLEDPGEMIFDNASNLFVQSEFFAIYRFDPSGNKITFSSDRLSPDKRWELKISDSKEGNGIVKAGTDQLVLDLSSSLGARASGASVVWAPDSKRLAINCPSGSHVEGADLYQLKHDEWVLLASPVDATLRILDRAKSAEKSKKGESEEESDSSDFDSWVVERWTDADTAVLYAHLRGSDYLFIFTLRFHKDGNWKIVDQTKEPAEK